MGDPGSAKTVLRLQDDEACARELLREVIGAAYPGDAGADDQDVEMFRGLLGGCRNGVGSGYIHFCFRGFAFAD